jgi:hypothetical protein
VKNYFAILVLSEENDEIKMGWVRFITRMKEEKIIKIFV